MVWPRPSRRACALRARRRGSAALEFALALPFLLTVLALVIDLGRLGFERTIVANAAHLAASMASMEGAPAAEVPSPDIQEAVEGELAQLPGFDAGAIELGIERVQEAGLDSVRVELNYPYRTMFDWPLMDSNVAMRQIVVMPCERGGR